MTPNRKPRRLQPLAAAVAALALSALAACDKAPDSRTAGQKVDDAVATMESKAEAAGDRMAQESAEVRRDVGEAVDDARITALVNAELARDPELSALKIDVDTTQGRVVLQGQAPNPDARERAERLASGIEGVHSVDNRLTVQQG
jgi:osmotically-inducible protein OsmY